MKKKMTSHQKARLISNIWKCVVIASLPLSLIYFHNNSVQYRYEDLSDYLVVLLTISSMVFTIMGIWIAFLYPNALQRLADPNKVEIADFSETKRDTKNLENIVATVLKSAAVVLSIMLIFLVKLIVSSFDVSEVAIQLGKEILLSGVLFLSLVQAEAIVYVMYSNIIFLTDLHSKRIDRELDEQI